MVSGRVPRIPGRLSMGACTWYWGSDSPRTIKRSTPGERESSGARPGWHCTITLPQHSDQGGVADELERVAEPLLAVQQRGALGGGRAVPERRGKRGDAVVLAQPPPFEFVPALVGNGVRLGICTLRHGSKRGLWPSLVLAFAAAVLYDGNHGSTSPN